MAIVIVLILPLALCLSPYIVDWLIGKNTVTKQDIKSIIQVAALLMGMLVFTWLEHFSYLLLATAILLFVSLQMSMDYFRPQIETYLND